MRWRLQNKWYVWNGGADEMYLVPTRWILFVLEQWFITYHMNTTMNDLLVKLNVFVQTIGIGKSDNKLPTDIPDIDDTDDICDIKSRILNCNNSINSNISYSNIENNENHNCNISNISNFYGVFNRNVVAAIADIKPSAVRIRP